MLKPCLLQDHLKITFKIQKKSYQEPVMRQNKPLACSSARRSLSLCSDKPHWPLCPFHIKRVFRAKGWLRASLLRGTKKVDNCGIRLKVASNTVNYYFIDG